MGGAMSKQKNGSMDPYQFSRAAYDEMRDAEVSYSVKFTYTLTSSAQKGVWFLVVRVAPIVEGETHKNHLTQSVWPNASATSFEAELYRATYRIVRMLENAVADYERVESARIKSAGGR